jgi:hypothetical protein
MTVLQRKIVSRRLTTCDVIRDGEAVRLDLVNHAGFAVSLEMSIEQAESVVMTLPRLLATAVKARTGDSQSRYVFPTGQWSLETTDGANCLLMTLTTTDGFEVTFGVPFAQCRGLGQALRHYGEVLEAAEEETSDAGTVRALN